MGWEKREDEDKERRKECKMIKLGMFLVIDNGWMDNIFENNGNEFFCFHAFWMSKICNPKNNPSYKN